MLGHVQGKCADGGEECEGVGYLVAVSAERAHIHLENKDKRERRW